MSEPRTSDTFVQAWLERYDTGHALPDYNWRDVMLDLRDARVQVKRLRDIATQFLAIVTAIDAARYPGLKCRICGRNYDHFPDCRLEALRQLAESAKACQKEDER